LPIPAPAAAEVFSGFALRGKARFAYSDPVRPLGLFATLVFCPLLLSGCGKRVTDANLKQVRPEMNPKEVESILGQPQRIREFDLELQTQKKTLEAKEYLYEQDGRTVVVHFVGDKMVKVNGSFEQ
jgi:hypothetical protein